MHKYKIGQRVLVVFNDDGKMYNDTVGQHCIIVEYQHDEDHVFKNNQYEYDVEMCNKSTNHSKYLGMNNKNLGQTLNMRMKILKDY